MLLRTERIHVRIQYVNVNFRRMTPNFIMTIGQKGGGGGLVTMEARA